jgi:hypothetical protein
MSVKEHKETVKEAPSSSTAGLDDATKREEKVHTLSPLQSPYDAFFDMANCEN